LSVREQLAREWAEDLILAKQVNERILVSYKQRIDISRHNKLSPNNSNKNDLYTPFTDRVCTEKSSGNDSSCVINDVWSTERHTFERESISLLNHHEPFNDIESSPLRRTSFDLLFLLLTQESIHRVLLSYSKAGKEKHVDFIWLIDYYKSSLEKYFEGNQRFGRADDFLDDLLLTPSCLKELEDGKIDFVDTKAIAEDIISYRSKVVSEWKTEMFKVPENHTELKENLHVRQMERWVKPVGKESITILETSLISDISAFQ